MNKPLEYPPVLQMNFAELSERMAADPRNAQIYTQLGFPYYDKNPAEARALQNHVVLDPTGLIIAMASIERQGEHTCYGALVAVREGHRGKGLAAHLMRGMLAVAQKEGRVLDPGEFSKMGQDGLMPLWPRLHQEFSDVRMKWNEQAAIDGTRPYRVELKGSNRKVVFS